MSDKIAVLKSGGPQPDIEIIIGQTNFAKYRIDLWDNAGANPDEIGVGTNVDSIPDEFSLGESVAKLAGRLLSWTVTITSFTGKPGDLYSVIVRITQDGKVVKGGQIVDAGLLVNGAKIVFDRVLLQKS